MVGSKGEFFLIQQTYVTANASVSLNDRVIVYRLGVYP